MAAVLACGSHAVLSHASSAELWGLDGRPSPMIHVSVPASVRRRRGGITIHRRRHLPEEHITIADGIPATDPILTLVDISATWPADRLEAAINQADKRNLVDPEALRAALPHLAAIPGVARLRSVLDRRTFRLTDSELERTFLRIVRSIGLEFPQTAVVLNGFKVDFFWPPLGLIVETDGLRYHRTPAQQAVDRHRDQVHTAAGFTTLRFTHAQVAYEASHVARVLVATAARLRRR